MKFDFDNMIKEICDENKINYKYLSKNWIIKLEKNNKNKYIVGRKFDLNSQSTSLILDDKYALYEVLRDRNIPIIEHRIVFNKTDSHSYALDCNSRKYVEDFFKKNNNHIVIKPNTGYQGTNVFNITNLNEIDEILDTLFSNTYSISICPFYNIKHEYRAIMLDGECKLLYAKHLPIVTGDGLKTIRQLLLEFNPNYFKDILDDPKYDAILKKDEKF